ncbi:MAG: hypothetical protein ACYDH9_03870 [Limisphaerales bacterium]
MNTVVPIGLASQTELIVALLDDIAVRQHYWVVHVSKYNERFASENQESSNLIAQLRTASNELRNEKSLDKKLNMALSTYSLGRQWLLKMAELSDSGESTMKVSSRNWTADLDDLIELAAWAAFRLRLLFGRNSGRFPAKVIAGSDDPAAKAIYQARWVRHCLPDLRAEVLSFDPDTVIATGYVCSGSWMYGVGRGSRSSEIQAQVLAELTSLDSAQDRAKSGAGMPARKDFFYLNGEKPVKGMDYLNWRELLRYSGSRARRRDRVLLGPPSGKAGEPPTGALDDPAPLYGIIQHELLTCLRIADLHRQEYAMGGSHATEVIGAVSRVAHQAINRIFAGAAKLHRQPKG